MNTLYSTLSGKIRLFLKGTTQTYSDELIRDGVNAALDAILPWYPKRQTSDVVVTSGSSVGLPEDAYYVDAVHDTANNEFLRRFSVTSGAVPANQAQWLEYPEGNLSFMTDLLVDTGLRIHYYRTWIKIENIEDTTVRLDTPPFADLALLYYACSYCLLSAATSTAQLRQFNTKIDSGTPEDNPLERMSMALMQRFLNEVKLFPALEKARK